MSDLKNKLIRLGSTNPELRPHLRPILAELDREASSFTRGPDLSEYGDDALYEHLEEEARRQYRGLGAMKALDQTIKLLLKEYDRRHPGLFEGLRVGRPSGNAQRGWRLPVYLPPADRRTREHQADLLWDDIEYDTQKPFAAAGHSLGDLDYTPEGFVLNVEPSRR